MKYTLLEMVQEILSSMTSDEVNSITDTVESEQVAHAIRQCYYDIVSNSNIPEHYDIFNLLASGDANLPTVMTKPDDIENILWVKYDNQTATDTDINYQPVTWMPLAEYLEYTQAFDVDNSNVETATYTSGAETYTLFYNNDHAPRYFTSFDDNTLFFDSYDSGVDTTLQGSKTQCYGERSQTFSLADNFTPDLDERQFALLLNEAKSLCWLEMKQTAHQKAEQQARRGWRGMQRTKHAIPGQRGYWQDYPDYGRK